MVPSKLLQNILSDIRIEINEENDKNFTRKAFFTEKWARRKFDDGKGSLMMRSGNLRRSVKLRNTATGLESVHINNPGLEQMQLLKSVTRQLNKRAVSHYYKLSLYYFCEAIDLLRGKIVNNGMDLRNLFNKERFCKSAYIIYF